MKKTFYCVVILISNSCLAQTQLEMNQTEQANFLKADKDLNLVYRSIVKTHKQDTIFIRTLKVSQQLWMRFREAEMKMMYPDRAPGYYGSIHPMCLDMYRTQLTIERTQQLKRWLQPSDEEDPCSPSIKMDQ